MEKTSEQIQRDLVRPLYRSGTAYWIAVAFCSSLVLAGVSAFCYQLYHGIGVWGLNSPVFWAFDITNFVFWIGISHAGKQPTLIAAAAIIIALGFFCARFLRTRPPADAVAATG